MPSALNIAQQQAVKKTRTPCFVLAGAGSGKTRVITYKIAHLIRCGLQPSQIAAITFTNKAALEMRERIKEMLGNHQSKDILICTFHSLGVRILRQDGHHLGFKPQFSIMDSNDIFALIRDIGSTTDNKLARNWQWQISFWKNAGISAQQAMANAESNYERQAATIMQEYQNRLTAYQAVDFDDLISLPLKLLQQFPEARAQWQDKLKHILVDEYQDTNVTQYNLLKQLIGSQSAFTVVGDDDQSIYGWRGATLDNLRRLSEDYPTLEIIKLEQNYRSTSAILRAANAVIQSNPKLFEKKLWSDLGEGDPILVLECDHEEHEAERTIARIQSIKTQTDGPWKDFAVLYRTNQQALLFEQALRRWQIPYKVSGGQSFFDKAEIRDLCAWLRLIINNNDDPAFLRAITTPKRGIGHQTLTALGQFASQQKVSLFEALFLPSLGAILSTKMIRPLHEFGRYINTLEQQARQTIGTQACAHFLEKWLEDMGYKQHLFTAQARWQNVQDFCNWMSSRASASDDEKDDEKSLLEIAQTISLIISLKENESDGNMVTLSTLHASKGLEWAHVVLSGVNEGILPMQSPDEGETLTPERLEEERRLMYVGITRARKTLTVSHVRRKRKRQGGASALVLVKPSRFISEMQLENKVEQEDPLAKIRALRAEFAARAALQDDDKGTQK